ncbi:glycosyltransferase involved in cell wall biosynthesis [Kineothrix alysoides]|uniref:Glycosyltransferase involved in cell wall biosynthesis n=1 Tax=Kineothrix alysoides TaxID=1469948 RepID=A0A4R1QRX8_9FIRM|nr:glycosyltransferase family A protein [Kineothrix alysoides]TCL56197.1 glycosyltransferase involved in cell wall biosynthesis [Kineothrix alysoides]
MPLFTFIIPAYNVEDYIEECVMSILKQDFSDFEILIVDDGSTDKSQEVCRKMARHDNRIKIYTQTNKGTSEARNIGVIKAKGEYIIFLDDDDYWLDNMLADLAKMVLHLKCDVVVFNYEIFDYYLNTITKDNLPLNIFGKNITMHGLEYLERILCVKRLYPWYPWCYAIKRRHLIDNKLFFKPGIRFEDVDLMFRVLINAKTITCFDKEVYHYRFNRQGAVSARSNINLKTENDKLLVIKNNIDFVKTSQINKKLKVMLCDNFSYLWFISLSLHSLFKNVDEKHTHENLLKKYISVSVYTKSFSLHLVRIAVKLLGIERAAFLCSKIIGMK